MEPRSPALGAQSPSHWTTRDKTFNTENNHCYDYSIEKLKMESRRYAKRQLTWFRRNEGAHWLEASLPREELVKEVLSIIEKGE